MKLLGHRNIKNTLLYTQLIDTEQEEHVCKIAKTAKEIAQLIQDGFEFVYEQQNLKFFRKRKQCLGLMTKSIKMPRAGFEPATTRSSAERSPRLSYLGNLNDFGYCLMLFVLIYVFLIWLY